MIDRRSRLTCVFDAINLHCSTKFEIQFSGPCWKMGFVFCTEFSIVSPDRVPKGFVEVKERGRSISPVTVSDALSAAHVRTQYFHAFMYVDFRQIFLLLLLLLRNSFL